MRSVLSVVLPSLLLAPTSSVDPANATNIVVYHVNPANYTGITNMDTADAAGDAFFALQGPMTTLDCRNTTSQHWGNECTNPEHASNNLTITKVSVMIDGNTSEVYGKCNICVNGTTPLSKHPKKCAYGSYVCSCSTGGFGPGSKDVSCPEQVGVESVNATFGKFPTYPGAGKTMFWMKNLVFKLGGNWFATTKGGECDDEDLSTTKGLRTDGTPCFWKLVATERKVAFECQQDALYAKVRAADKASCFSACGSQATNTSSTCAIECLYATLLGHDGGSVVDASKGLAGSEIKQMWVDAFDGCPNLM